MYLNYALHTYRLFKPKLEYTLGLIYMHINFYHMDISISTFTAL